MRFGTKAEVLERLEPDLRAAAVLPQVRFTAQRWRQLPLEIVDEVARRGWLDLIVRSSAVCEDSEQTSMAGHFCSILDVSGPEALSRAVDEVVESLNGEEDQVFVQPMLKDVVISGVAFGRDPNTGGPYRVINYDDRTGSTNSVTSGAANDLKTYIYARGGPSQPPTELRPVLNLLDELEQLLGDDRLDVEFAIDSSGQCYLFQVRRLVMAAPASGADEKQLAAIHEIARKVRTGNRPHPYLHGPRTVYGVMPDWNPAEIIGIRPRPLAMSLYRDLVTDAIWAYQRDNYGYSNLRSFPLMVDFHGLPYIDVRVSFNSFVPRDLSPQLADRLVSYYVERLRETPSLHDKVEFHIIFSCFTFDLQQRIQVLKHAGFSSGDVDEIRESLRSLTKTIINPKSGLWQRDLEKIGQLQQRHAAIQDAELDDVSRIYWLLEDCKRYGTLPFAGLARAGFIAVQLLQSLVAVGVLTSTEYEAYMGSLDSVSSRMTHDFSHTDREEFLKRYGHLRPGTYDILSPRYDEAPDRYFDWASRGRSEHASERPSFRLSLDQLKRVESLLKEHQLDLDILELFDFIKAGIEGREYSKFVFSRSLSDAISLFRNFGQRHGFSDEDMSFADAGIIHELYVSSHSERMLLERSIAVGREQYAVAKQISLPPLIADETDVWGFHVPRFEPNFVTQKSATGQRVTPTDSQLGGGIIMIPSADPGFDWIFSRGIAGFITKYGGLNSHMAIRAGELGIPAVIGAGESLYEQWNRANVLELDCANRKVRILHGGASRIAKDSESREEILPPWQATHETDRSQPASRDQSAGRRAA